MIKYRSLCYSLKSFETLCNRTSVKNSKQITKLHNLKSISTLNKTYLSSYRYNYIFKKNISLAAINYKSNDKIKKKSYGGNDKLFSNESDDDDGNDKLFSNKSDDDDEEDETIEIKDGKSDKDNSDNKLESNNLNDKEKNNIPIYIKKSKYDSDKILIFEDITELPDYMCSPPLNDEEIEQINTGLSNYDFGVFSNSIIHRKK